MKKFYPLLFLTCCHWVFMPISPASSTQRWISGQDSLPGYVPTEALGPTADPTPGGYRTAKVSYNAMDSTVTTYKVEIT